MSAPFMLTARDDELLGVANRSDAMGVLAIWSARGRDLVPHLTEQTTNVRGFQILVEAFRLWERYQDCYPGRAGAGQADELARFFVLVEQAFARVVAGCGGDWRLPGARRVRARSSEPPRLSWQDESWHLLRAQRANGLWGLYRGASQRAGLLCDDMTRLSDETLRQASQHHAFAGKAEERLLELVKRAMDETVALPTDRDDDLVKALCDTFAKLPLAAHLRERLIDSHDLTRELAARLPGKPLDHRRLLIDVAQDRDDHRSTIEDAIHCENLIAVVETVLLWLCASKGMTVLDAADGLPTHLVAALASARRAFHRAGRYPGGVAQARHQRLATELETRTRVELVHSVLALHEKVSKERGRAVWVWQDQGRLHSDVDVQRPSEADLQVGAAWRNDYYLHPLQQIASQLAEHFSGLEARP